MFFLHWRSSFQGSTNFLNIFLKERKTKEENKITKQKKIPVMTLGSLENHIHGCVDVLNLCYTQCLVSLSYQN